MNKKKWYLRWWAFSLYFLLIILYFVTLNGSSSTTISPQLTVRDTTATSTPVVATTKKNSEKVDSVTNASNKSGPARLYPNPDLTPGDVLTTDTAKVCTSGYSSTVRNVPLSEKEQVYAEYGVSYPQPTGAYEVDHFISLELGGSNDIKNLFLEPAEPRPGFHEKDKVENYLHSQVCSGKMTLQEAQHGIASDWYKYYLLIASGTPTTATASIKTTNTTTVKPTTSVATPSDGPEVKKSSSDICHQKGSQYYDKIVDYIPYATLEACISSGGRLPLR